jgi:glyoxylase-like metal-dependent hydrolase (beta-lactamase superfamily II)
MEVVRGVHQIKLPFPKGISEDANVYLLEGSEGDILIDTGWDSVESLAALQQGLKEDRLSFKHIQTVVVTHIHPDHYGLASKIKQICGATVTMHRIEAELIGSRYVDSGELLQGLGSELKRNGVPQDELPDMVGASSWMKPFVVPENPDVLLDQGDRINNGTFTLEVLWMPGHSPGHICLYEPRRRLFFSGDHVLFDAMPNVGLHPQSGENPMNDYIGSLRRTGDVGASFVFPGHGPTFSSLKLRVADTLRYREQRKRIVMQVLRDDIRTAYQVAQEIYQRQDMADISFASLDAWHKRSLLLETIAYIKALMIEGDVGMINREGVALYLAKD